MQKLCVLSLLVFCFGLSCNAWTADQKDVINKNLLIQIAQKHGALGITLCKDLISEIKNIVSLTSLQYQPNEAGSPCQLIICYNSSLTPKDIFAQIPTRRTSFHIRNDYKYSGWEVVLNTLQSKPTEMVLDFKQIGKK